MANLTETSSFDAVPQLETTTQALGGPGGPLNGPGQALANRTKFLKDTKADVAGAAFTGPISAPEVSATALATPAAPNGVPSAGGGTLPAGTYYAKIVAVDGKGNTTAAGAESPGVVVSGSTSSIAFTWAAIIGAASYQIWYGTASGAEGKYFTSTTNSFTLAADAGTAGTIPAVNGTGSMQVDNNLNVSGNAALQNLAVAKQLGLPVWTTATRPAGGIGFNSTLNQFEGYNPNTSSWGALGGGATGAPGNNVFFENDQVVSGNYAITTGKNAMCAGPITINPGVTLTVPSGSVLTIV